MDFQDHVRETTVLSDFNKPLLARTTRWEYMSRYFPLWKDTIRFRVYQWALGLLALFLLFNVPILILPCIAAIGYFQVLITMRRDQLTSSRKVIIGH